MFLDRTQTTTFEDTLIRNCERCPAVGTGCMTLVQHMRSAPCACMVGLPAACTSDPHMPVARRHVWLRGRRPVHGGGL